MASVFSLFMTKFSCSDEIMTENHQSLHVFNVQLEHKEAINATVYFYDQLEHLNAVRMRMDSLGTGCPLHLY
jgi:hypothetical protein